MDFEQMIGNITPDIHANLKRAIELGKWPDGKRLTKEQVALCMEAVITYEKRFVSEENRVGFIDKGSKEEGEVCDSTSDQSLDSSDESREELLKWH